MDERLSSSTRVWLAVFSLGGPPALLVADAAVAALLGWQPRARVEAALLALAASIPAALAVACAFAPVRRWLARRMPQLVLLSASLLAAWIASEITLHACFADLLHDPINARYSGLAITFRPRPEVMPGIQGASHYTTNRLGLRGPEPPPRDQAFRILCLGGSTTECTYLDDGETWPSLLMRRLETSEQGRRVWVAAAAQSGATMREHLRFAERSPLMREIDCLVILAGVNDLAAALAPDPKRMARPAAPLVATGATQADPERLEPLDRGGRLEAEDPEGLNYVVRRRRRAAAEIVDRPVRVPAASYPMEIRALVAACRQQNVRPVFLTQPVLWSDTISPAAQRLLWLGRLDERHYLSVAELRRLMDEFTAALVDVCREEGIDVIDLSSMSGREEYFYDDCHFNEAGAREVARLVAEGLKRHGIP